MKRGERLLRSCGRACPAGQVFWVVWVLENRNKDFEERKGMSMSEIVKVAEIFGKNVFTNCSICDILNLI